jgi:stearoyl-CoA 9-desaturase NADPH oxidoreductase
MTPNQAKQQSPLNIIIQSIFSPTTFDFWASHIHPTWSWERPLARIVGLKIEAQDSLTVTIKPNRHCKPFLAGQHIYLTTEINGVRVTRSYSPSRVPNRPGVFNVTIKKMAGGKVSTWFHTQASVGQVLEVGAPFGEMTLANDTQNQIFLAAGSGITPFISLIRQWAAQGACGRLTLVYWAKKRAELCFVEELAAFSAIHKNLNIHYALTQESAIGDDELRGRISADQLEIIIAKWDNAIVYACGPSEFVEQARNLTKHATDFHGEAFSIIQPVTMSDQRVNIELTQSKRTISVPVGQSLLTALEAEGLKPAYGCRRGICNTCVCIKKTGTTEHILTKDQDHETGSSVRICVNSARSDLVLDL